MQVFNGTPRPNVARMEKNERGWSIWLSPDATVLELAALMGGLQRRGRRMRAEDMGGGAFVLFPEPGDLPPLAEEIIDIMTSTYRGPLPTLRSIEDYT